MSEESVNARYEACISELDTVSNIVDAIEAWEILAKDAQVFSYWHSRGIDHLHRRHEALLNLKNKLERQRQGFWSNQPNRKIFDKYARLKTEYHRVLEVNEALKANYAKLLDEYKEASTNHFIFSQNKLVRWLCR